MEVCLVDGDSPWDFTVDYGALSKTEFINHTIINDLRSGEYAPLESFEPGDYVSYFNGVSRVFRALVLDLLPDNLVRLLNIDEFKGVNHIVSRYSIFKLTVNLIQFPPQCIKCCFVKNLLDDIKLLWYQFKFDEIFVNLLKKHRIYIRSMNAVDDSLPQKYLVRLYAHNLLLGRGIDVHKWIRKRVLPELMYKLNRNMTRMLSKKARDPFYFGQNNAYEKESDIKSSEKDYLIIPDCLSSTSEEDYLEELDSEWSERVQRWVNSINLGNMSYPINMCESYFDNKCCTAVECSKQHSPSVYLEENRSNLPPGIRIPFIGRIIPMKILKIVSTKQFYASMALSDSEQQSIKQLMDDMNHPIAVKTHFHILERIRNNQMVLAKGKDGLYRRAEVQLIEQEKNMIKVLYCDFGYCEYVHRKNLRQVSLRYLHLPFQALLVSFAINLSVAKENEMINYLERQIWGKVMPAEVISLNPPDDSKLVVKLHFGNGNCLDNTLIELGYVY